MSEELRVVISVVYDGPPRAGKTTSVRALARSFGRTVYTPEERDGRTIYFDWLEHIGGRFEGAPIHCQIASVPGQRRWTRRRGYFLDRADVVVFVGDTTAKGWPETVARLSELRAMLDRRTGPAVGLVFQANKRDCEDAVPLDEVMLRAANARTAVVESIAEDGTGIREAFVFAVRLALDRVREDPDRTGVGFETVGPALFDHLRAVDPDPISTDDPLDDLDETPTPTTGLPLPPSHEAPSGFVWPPIEGRILLREALPTQLALAKAPNGDYLAASNDGWHVHSPAAAQFDELDAARGVLVGWARMHATTQTVALSRRCIVLAATGDGRWRLWQIVKREPSLRELVANRVLEVTAAERLVDEASTACALPCSLDSLGVTELARPRFVGLMPGIET
ncbi:MAG TPA: GTPase domain-containing protein [Kofleriaceae bacterium]